MTEIVHNNPPTQKTDKKDPYPWGKSPYGWKAGAGSGSCLPGADIKVPKTTGTTEKPQDQ